MTLYIVQTEDGKITVHETREGARKELDGRVGPGRILVRKLRT